MEIYYLYLIELIKDTINPNEVTYRDDLDYSILFTLAKKHLVATMVYEGIEKISDNLDKELVKQWKEVHDKAIVKDIIQRKELDHLVNLFADNQINTLPLKGCLLKQIYPKTYQREMSDLDICVSTSSRKEIKKLMTKEGYEVKEFGHVGHDVYFKKPVLNIEIHDYLIPSDYKKLDAYFKDGFSLAREIKPFYYQLSREDFYLHMVAHAYKHYYGSGTGIRTVLDFYLYRKFYNDLDFNYIKQKLDQLEIAQFENNIYHLSLVWFEDKDYSKELKEMEEYILNSGTYGTKVNKITREYNEYTRNIRKERNKKWIYSIKRLFPNYTKMKMWFPIVGKYKILLPFCYMYRLIRAILFKRDIISMEIQILHRINKD